MTTPPRIFRAIPLMAFLSSPRAARAEGDPPQAESRSCVDEVDPDDPGQLVLSWAWGEPDDLLPILTLRTPDRDGLFYRLDARLRFRGEEWAWSQEPVDVAAYTEVDVDIDDAELQSWSDDQEEWTSTLAVTVVVTDDEGNERLWKTAPFLRMVWVEGVPRLLTADAADVLAPQGAWTASAQAANPSALDDETVNEYGGESGVESGGEG